MVGAPIIGRWPWRLTRPLPASTRARSETLGRFWAAVLGLDFEPDGEAGALTGTVATQRVWMNVVPEAKAVKHRVHLDVHCASDESLVKTGRAGSPGR